MIQNSKGKIFYGMHFYPGVAEYAPEGKEPFRVFLNEDTIRAMDPSFAGRPVFLMHVDDVETDVDVLRKDADGWVIESFYNQADGKHWAKFIVVSEKAERAIERGMRLSNAYVPQSYGAGGLWNGVAYQKEITGGEYEHLAIVPNPRYEESVILTPEEFKRYNDEKFLELKKLANNNDDGKGKKGMKLNFFKRAKVENSIDLENIVVALPKSGRELTITQLVNEVDEAEEKKKAEAKEAPMANGDHCVEYGGAKMTVNEMLAKHKAMHDELEAMKAAKNGDGDDFEAATPPTEVAGVNADDDDTDLVVEEPEDKEVAAAKKKNEEDEEEKKEEKKKNELEAAKKKAEAKAKADRLKNAPDRVEDAPVRIETSDDQVQRGKSRYGS